MNVRACLFIFVLLWSGWLAPVARAHSPFDCSARAIVHVDSAEVMLTVGSSLGETFLRPANVVPGQMVIGRPFPLAPVFATNLFTTTADGSALVARAADVITDGVEYSFRFEYALAPAKTVGIEAHFLPSLKPPHAVPLVLTDENANLLASAILSLEKTGTEFALTPPSPRPNGERVGVRGIESTNQGLLTPALSSRGGEGEIQERSVDTPATHAAAPSFMEFLKLGIGHILCVDAFDHLLFLLALLLGCRKLKPMLLVITGFTVAHSLTLALAALDLVQISPRLVEPAIAASIIFVAAGNFRKRMENGESKMAGDNETKIHPPSSTFHPRSQNSWRYTLTCAFGLIHGFGFAGVLRETGLAGTGMAIAKPLLAFNIGVEIGQLTVAAILLPLLLLLERWPWFARNGARAISAFVMAVAAWWLWERLAL